MGFRSARPLAPGEGPLSENLRDSGHSLREGFDACFRSLKKGVFLVYVIIFFI